MQGLLLDAVDARLDHAAILTRAAVDDVHPPIGSDGVARLELAGAALLESIGKAGDLKPIAGVASQIHAGHRLNAPTAWQHCGRPGCEKRDHEQHHAGSPSTCVRTALGSRRGLTAKHHRVMLDTRQQGPKHQTMEWHHGVPVEQSDQATWFEEGGLPERACGVASRRMVVTVETRFGMYSSNGVPLESTTSTRAGGGTSAPPTRQPSAPSLTTISRPSAAPTFRCSTRCKTL